MRPRLSAFIASSLDGFIADSDGSLIWLEEAADEGEDYGFHRFVDDVDAVAMGRGTYDVIRDIDPHPYGDRELYVLTHAEPVERSGVTFWSVGPEEATLRWAELGLTHVYVDGGYTISSFLRAGLLDDLLITVVPRLLGGGHRLFVEGVLAEQVRLVQTSIDAFPSGMVNLGYSVVRERTDPASLGA